MTYSDQRDANGFPLRDGGGGHRGGSDALGRPSGDGPVSAGTSSVRAFLRMLRRRWPIIVVCMIVAGAATYVVESRRTKEYSATAQMLFRNPGLGSQLFGGSGNLFSPSSDPTREAATNLKLVTSGEVVDATAAALGGGVTPAQVAGEVTASNEGNSDLVSVTATDPSPPLAARMANEFVRQFIEFRQRADRSKVLEARDLLLQQIDELPESAADGPEARNLRDRADQLLTLAALQTGNAEIVQRAGVPTTPSSPHVKRMAVLGAALGLLVGLAIAFLIEQLDRSVKDNDEIEHELGAPILGSVPETRTIRGSVATEMLEHPADLEPFDTVRTNLRYLNIERPIRSVLVTSAQLGDGKTTVAWNLAAAAARSGSSVLLIEADLRRPRLAANGTLSRRTGLSTLLAGMNELDEVIQTVPLGRDDGTDTALDVMPAGPVPPNPVGLLESTAMRQLIDDMSSHYDLVVVDTPPVSAAADAIPLTQYVNGVLVVVRLNTTQRDALVNLRSQFANVGAPLLGVVVNGAKVLGAYRAYT